jgi:methylmalonyl-CoA/ethylmalonyl-CoA epimerase
LRTFQEGATMQVAMVVRDMDAAMKRHWEVFKIGPWDFYTFDAAKVRDTHTAASRRRIPA